MRAFETHRQISVHMRTHRTREQNMVHCMPLRNKDSFSIRQTNRELAATANDPRSEIFCHNKPPSSVFPIFVTSLGSAFTRYAEKSMGDCVLHEIGAAAQSEFVVYT